MVHVFYWLSLWSIERVEENSRTNGLAANTGKLNIHCANPPERGICVDSPTVWYYELETFDSHSDFRCRIEASLDLPIRSYVYFLNIIYCCYINITL